MAGEWKYLSVSNVAVPVLGGTPDKSEPEYWGGEILWATAKDIASVRGRYLFTTEQTITQAGLEHSAAKLLPKGTVVITARGTVGAIAQLATDMSFNQTCYGLIPKKGIDPDFLYYVLKGTLFEMKSLTYGTVFETITMRSFEHWIIPVPPLPIQRTIAHILGTLDEKIELLRRMNETLEAMARALFKSWFVDFDPVIDNALEAGNPIPDELKEKAKRRLALGERRKLLPEHIRRLFPDRFVDSELGPIPDGWEVGTLGDICEIAIGGDWGTNKRFDDSVQVVCLRGVDLQNLRESGSATPPLRWVKISSLKKRTLSERDVLIATSGAGPIGRSLWFNPAINEVFSRPVIYSNFCRKLRAISWSHAIYTDQILFEIRESGEYLDYVTGTSVPNLDLSGLLNGRNVVLPSNEILELYGDFVSKVTTKLYSRESYILTALRDTLLPKLISGEIRVENVKRFLEEGES